MSPADQPLQTPGETTLAVPAATSGESDCWNHIGIYGQRSCAKLPELAHCRNCPVFSAAALRLLDRPAPPDYRREWTAQIAEGSPLREPRHTSAILFRIQNEWLALPTQSFQEATDRRPIHSLPHRRHGIILGLANVRGELLITVSLGHFLGLENLPAPDALRATYHRLLVANYEGRRLAFPADEVHGPHHFSPHEFSPLPSPLAQPASRLSQAVVRWQGHTIGCLEPQRLFAGLERSLA